MEALGQIPQVMVKAGQDALDRLLEAEGWAVKDPVAVLAAPVEALTTERPPPVTVIEVWPPLAIQREIWAAGGIGPARLAVMERAPEPKTTLLGRVDDRPAATAYVGVHDGLAVLHALETAARFRRRGLARHMMRGAAFWARENGATHLAVLVTRANGAANALYAGLGMAEAAHYHYRIREAP
ncbi:GNAT family N-acetyltransferase [Wenxinia marina]|uniref:Acetyltransferase n=2 Tax=Wenxinia TaxID=653686 RepID=A0A0D0QIG7_9RHOB|nr:Acetyltransferase [Wenxinia marina DSM 24838]